MMKRVAIVLLVLLLAAIAGLAGLGIWVRSHPGTAPVLRGGVAAAAEGVTVTVEQWCGQQLLRIANHFLEPELRFASIDYVHPRAVVLRDVVLTTEGVDFVQASSMKIEFARVPRVGEPVVIELIELAEPAVRLVERADGRWIGLGNLVEATEGRIYDDGGSTRPVDTFALRRVALINGSVDLEPRDRPAMRLDRLTLDLHADPAEDRTGLYTVSATIRRPEILEAVLDGRLDLIDHVLEVQHAGLDAEIGPERHEFLPPSLQAFLASREITGSLAMSGQGSLHLADPSRHALDGRLTLSDGHVVLGDSVLPVDWLELTARVDGRRVHAEPLYAHVLGGSVRIAGWVDAVDDWPASFEVEAADVPLGRLVRRRNSEEIRGLLSATGFLDVRLSDIPSSLDGQGHLDMTDGFTFGVPFLERVVGAFKLGKGAGSRGAADVVITGERARFDRIELVGTTSAARGQGEIRYDSTLSFQFNAGPIERLQAILGPVGDLVGSVTDKLVTYEVTGTLSEPEVKTRPFGVGKGKEPGKP